MSAPGQSDLRDTSLIEEMTVSSMTCISARLPGVDFVRPISSVIPGVQGRALAVLAETTAELNLRTLARLAGVSVAQMSRVLPELVELGLVDRREVPPSSLFRLNRGHVASRAVLALGSVRQTVLGEIGSIALGLPEVPRSVIVFGSFARGEADAESDIDVVVVRPSSVAAEAEKWEHSVHQLRDRVRTITGNRVEVLEVGEDAAAVKLVGRTQVWRDIRRDGIVVHGTSIEELSRSRRG